VLLSRVAAGEVDVGLAALRFGAASVESATSHGWLFLLLPQDLCVDIPLSVSRHDAQPDAILDWALAAFDGRIALSCSFGGPTGMATIDMIHRAGKSVPVYFLDTGLLFPETLHVVEQIRARYGIDVTAVRPRLSVDAQAAAFGPELWARDPDRCCAIRKVAPQAEHLRDYDALITGLRRDQSNARATTAAVETDARFNTVKINPFVAWTEAQIWAYIRRWDVPYNPLNDRGFPSVGCGPCTRAIQPGEDRRAGRWTNFAKTECGLHRPAEPVASH
jgi:phosphoadenosine phosphosulfate reductase